MRRDLIGLHAALVLSGAAGLMYQSSWTRLLQRVFGVGDLAVATVLATFFLGLGLGNALSARFVSRVTRPRRAYAILEVGVGLYALFSLAIAPGIGAAYGGLSADMSFGSLTVVRFCLACLMLMPPTILMGATLPIVAEVSKGGAWSGGVTAFYTSNTLGAVIGAAFAGFVAVPYAGTRATVIAGALLSFIAAAVVGLALRDTPRAAEPEAPPSASSEPAAADASGTTPIRLAAALAFLTGMTALGSEVVWTRVLRIIVHGTTSAFAAMLVNYLLGIAVGAVVARALSRRFHPATVLGLSQTLLIAFTAIAMALVPFAPRLIPILANSPDTVPHATWIIGLVSGILLFPLATVLGTGLPSTWAMIDRHSDPGRGAAVMLAANTLGGLVGSLVTGFGLIPTFGSEATLLALLCVNAVTASIALRHAASKTDDRAAVGGRVLRFVGPLAVLTAAFMIRPSIELNFLLGAATDPVAAVIAGPNDSWNSRTVFMREGRNTTVTVIASGTSLVLFNDGRPESGFGPGTPGFGPELVVLGGLPGVLSGSQRDAMVIGLGAGHTAAVALASGFENVRVIELEEGVVEAARLLYHSVERPFPLDDPRAHLVVDDARNQLNLMDADSLDVVISQPSHPWLAGSSALYTLEFFREVDRALREDGVFGLWINVFRMDVPHLRSVLATLTSVFPYVRAFVVESSSLILMASSAPRPIGPEHTTRIRSTDAAVPYFAPYALGDATGLLAHQELDEAAVTALAMGGTIIEDDRPILELELAALPAGTVVDLPSIDRALRGVPWSSDAMSDDVLLARIGVVETRLAALERVAAMDGLSPMVLARIMEARGDVTGALAAYDAVASPEALGRAAELRYESGLYGQLLAMSFTDTVPAAYFRAALTEPEVSPEATERATRGDTPLTRFVATYGEGGCAAVETWPGADLEDLASAFHEVAHVLLRCAAIAGNERARDHAEHVAWRGRSAVAGQWTRAGEAALEGGNGGLAWMHFRAALRIYPTTTRAAIGLARLHHRDGRIEDARATLVAAFQATGGLDEARQRIVQAATAVHIDLGATDLTPGVSASSTSTERPSMVESDF